MVHPDTSTLEGLETFLKTWFVLKFNTHYHDPALLKHSFHELMVLFYVHKIHDDPNWYEAQNQPNDEEDYEEWIKKMMGDDYTTEEEMVEDMVKYEEEEKQMVAQLPESISTDFTDPDLLKE